MSEANERQVGGDHYKGATCPHCGKGLEHWDLAWLFRWDNFQYAITKYVMRWREKAGLQDLRKAAHCLEKYIEVVGQDETKATLLQPGDLGANAQILEHRIDHPLDTPRFTCQDELCPGHHKDADATCEDDPPGPLAGTRPT